MSDHSSAGKMNIFIWIHLSVLLSVFTTLFENIDYKKSQQKDYKMLQVADLICTTELIRLKMERGLLSRSERHILGGDKEIKKLLFKPLQSKEML